MKQKANVRFEVFTAVAKKNSVFWDITPCGGCEVETLCVRFLCSVRRLLVTANVVPSSPILVALMMEGLGSSVT
jgi:hypothetical protein